MAYYEACNVRTNQRMHWVDVTRLVEDMVTRSGIRTGICLVSSPHTTAGMTINENADPAVGIDIFRKLAELIPQQDGYHHAEGNSDSHLKATLTGFSVTVPIRDGRLALGTWQAVYLCEFDGPRARTIAVTIVGD